jgi:hypothetical protein
MGANPDIDDVTEPLTVKLLPNVIILVDKDRFIVLGVDDGASALVTVATEVSSSKTMIMGVNSFFRISVFIFVPFVGYTIFLSLFKI